MILSPENLFIIFNQHQISSAVNKGILSNVEYSTIEIQPLNDDKIEYYTNKYYHLFDPYWTKDNLLKYIKDYIKFAYNTNLGTINDIPPPFLILNYLGIDIPDDKIQEVSKIHSDMVRIITGEYKPSKIRGVKEFKYAMFGQGRNQIVYGMENVIFNSEITSDNTFYIDINPEFNPDSTSDLTKNDELVYDGEIVPFSKFEIITLKGCGYDGGELYRNDLFGINSNKILFENLHKYLKSNGIIQITPEPFDVINFDNISHLYTVVYDNGSVLLFKL